MRANVHASCIVYKRQGILILGQPGFGKSDLCLRLIMGFGAKLVADDRVNLTASADKLSATAPTILKGMLEVRGVGIIRLPPADSARLRLAVKLTDRPEEVERLPAADFYEFGGVKIPQITLCAKEFSAPEKILAALTLL